MHPINCCFVRICQGTNDYIIGREKKYKEARELKRHLLSPHITRHWAGSSAYMYYALNVHNDPVHAQLLSHVRLFETPLTVTRQAPLSMEFFRQGYWSGMPFPPPVDLPSPEIKPASLVWPNKIVYYSYSTDEDTNAWGDLWYCSWSQLITVRVKIWTQISFIPNSILLRL